jgi:hypothetical protein
MGNQRSSRRRRPVADPRKRPRRNAECYNALGRSRVRAFRLIVKGLLRR